MPGRLAKSTRDATPAVCSTAPTTQMWSAVHASPPPWGWRPAVSVGEQMPWAVPEIARGSWRSGRPVIVVIDDVHWAEPTASRPRSTTSIDWVRGAGSPPLPVRDQSCSSCRPGWGGGHAHVNSIVLPPLNDEHRPWPCSISISVTGQLSDSRAGSDSPDRGRQSAIRRATAVRSAARTPRGIKPARHPRDGSEACWRRGSIASGPGERAFIERAAVIGREFWPGSGGRAAAGRGARPFGLPAPAHAGAPGA